MKAFRLWLVLAILVLGSCEKDNYEGPDAGLSGSFFDAATNELVEQDIIRGTTIELIEHGYDPVAPQYLVIKNNGTYENRLLFANTYTVRPVRGNFVPVEAQEIAISGLTHLDFKVTPYLRLKDVSIEKNANKIQARFRLEQTTTDNVRKIGLYAHVDSRVGEPMRLVAAERQINAVTDPGQEYTLEIDLPSNSSNLKPGGAYFFRIGALSGASEAKLNYAPAVRITL